MLWPYQGKLTVRIRVFECVSELIGKQFYGNERRRMIVKKTMGFVLIGLLLILVGCGGKYSDLVEVNTEFVNAMEEYITGMEKASSATEMANAINTFADDVEVLAPKMKKVREKYPELKNNDTVPEELKPVQQKAEDLQNKVAGSFMNMMKYIMNPEVQAAQKRLQTAMMGMR